MRKKQLKDFKKGLLNIEGLRKIITKYLEKKESEKLLE